jgi:hypothetical protein
MSYSLDSLCESATRLVREEERTRRAVRRARDVKRKRRDRIEPERSRVTSTRSHTVRFDAPLTDQKELARRRARAWWWTADDKSQWVSDAAASEVASDFPIDGVALGTSDTSSAQSSVSSSSVSSSSASNLYDELSVCAPEQTATDAPVSCLSAAPRKRLCDDNSPPHDPQQVLCPAQTPLTIQDRAGRVEPLHVLRAILLDMPAAAVVAEQDAASSVIQKSRLFDRLCAHFAASSSRQRLVRILNGLEAYTVNSTPHLRGCIRSPITEIVVQRQARNCAQPLARVFYWLCHNRQAGTGEQMLRALGGEFVLVSRCGTSGCVNPQHYQHTCAARTQANAPFSLALFRLFADDEPTTPLKNAARADSLLAAPVELKFN